ncbi:MULTISPECIES: hypothetical protein [Acinetobacter]|nr:MULTISPECIES: hypothetical protein [Acinetobacter]ENV56534.1 hypothetical protein F951_02232 [Acinetobacter soli CIP 110264]MCL9676928.1 hypothetical protein [Acinetobacter sp. ACZLY 512]PPB86162.1 hypothetical protein AsoHEU7_10955 [Acinetobacter soli]WEI11867.1 hypothetical protein PX667_10240 [Acinetobacter soli]WEI15896.1 hypothetical protein PX668_03040 [Acinetobacter soli]
MKNNIFKFMIIVVTSISPLLCHADNTITFKGNIVEDTCSTSNIEKECTQINTLNITIDTQFLNQDNILNLAEHTEKMDTSIETITANKKVVVLSYH